MMTQNYVLFTAISEQAKKYKLSVLGNCCTLTCNSCCSTEGLQNNECYLNYYKYHQSYVLQLSFYFLCCNLLIFIQRTKLSCRYRNTYLHCGYFYLMGIRVLPASDEPLISESLNARLTIEQYNQRSISLYFLHVRCNQS